MRRVAATALLLAALVAGCGEEDTAPEAEPEAAPRIVLTSADFERGGDLPRAATCDGDGQPPALQWSGVPDGTRSLALVVEDPDAPGDTYVHWTVWGLDPAATALFGSGPVEGANSSGERGYGPPCPPEGDPPHRYRFVLYALDRPLELRAGAQPDEVRDGIERLAIARGVLQGRYARR